MVKKAILVVIACFLSVSLAHAVIILTLDDEFDDVRLVCAASDQDAVKAYRQDLEKFEQVLLAKQKNEIEGLLGKPNKRASKTYAMPVAQLRGLTLSGIRYADRKLNKNHTSFYLTQDFAGVEVWYGINGTTPVAVLVYFKVDKSFPKLTDTNLNQRLSWDRERFAKLVKYVEQVSQDQDKK